MGGVKRNSNVKGRTPTSCDSHTTSSCNACSPLQQHNIGILTTMDREPAEKEKLKGNTYPNSTVKESTYTNNSNNGKTTSILTAM